MVAKYYKATSEVAQNWAANNARWIQRQIASGKKIYDIGPEGKQISSEFYDLEVKAVERAGQRRYTLGGLR